MRGKKILIICLTLVCFISNYSRDFEVKRINNGFEVKVKFLQHIYTVNNKSEVNFILDEDESNVDKPKLPVQSLIFAIPPESKVEVEITDKKIIQINNVTVALNSKSEQLNNKVPYKKVEKFNSITGIYPEEEYKILGYTWIREFYCVIIQVNTHRYSFSERKLYIIEECNLKLIYTGQKDYLKNNEPSSLFDNVLKKIITNYDEALEFRSFNKIMGEQEISWIDYSKDYIKLAISKDNIYRVTYNYLLTNGINPNLITPKTIKAYINGKEIPIYVKGEGDNKFDESDYIEFYCEKNYSKEDYRKIVNKGENYIHYMNLYTDTSYVWLTWGGENGKRINIENTAYSATSDIIDYHLVKLHLEQDIRLWYYDATEPRVQLPFWQENKLYTWLVIGNSGNINVNFNATDFLPNTNVTLMIRLISYAADIASNPNGIYNTHKVGVNLNNSELRTITYDFKETVNFTSIFNSYELKKGNNVIKISGISTSVSFHQSLIDWIDVEYLRKNLAVNDSILITIPEGISKKLRLIKIENINCSRDELRVYKIYPEFKKFENFYLEKGTNTLYVIDTVASGYKYFITKNARIDEPIFKYKKQFINLRDKSRKADYIIITNKLLTSSAREYKNFISNSYNVKVELVFDEDIYDEFSYGQIDAQAIKNFLIAAYKNWQAPRPSYLTIIGDANYDYKNVTFLSKTKKNLVLSYGFPVSDVWYVIWDTVKNALPQMFIGRIPANNDDEVYFYLQKHKKYISKRYDIFNKTFLFFSGGNTAKEDELQEIKNVNDFLYQKYVLSSPFYGKGTHFYKTLSPQTNFGPYSKEDIQSIIDEGGIFISYIGHSGTRTWDNGITEVEHIKNKYSDRFPLITDFGCSTAKFAEPDVDAFGELFICQSFDGQAIAYLGNSSWGYLSTSLRFPKYFYDVLLIDTIKCIGYIHLLAKVSQLIENGFNDVNRVFTYCNLLLGDPIVKISLPNKPNLFIDYNKIKILADELNDGMDSASVKILISNYGIFIDDTVKIKLFDNHSKIEKILKVKFPKLEDTVVINIPIKNLPGEHQLNIELDVDNKIDEVYEDDNVTQFRFIVNSMSLLPLVSSKYYNVIYDTLYILNSFNKPEGDEVVLQVADNPDFISPIIFTKKFDTLVTKITTKNLTENKRYYCRLKVNDQTSHFTEIYSFKKIKDSAEVFIDEPLFNSKDFIYSNTIYDKNNKCWKLNNRRVSLIVKSAGWLDGSFGSILYDNQEQLPNTYYWGLAAAIIDSVTLRPKSIKYFLVPDAGVMDSLTNFINSLKNGTIVAMTICADAQQSILGGKNSKSRIAIKKLGSVYIDSVQYRDSWCILGKKGAIAGSVPEAYKKQLNGTAQIEIFKDILFGSGFIVFPEINNVNKWGKIVFKTEKPDNSKIILTPLGKKFDGTIDTLNNLSTNMNELNLENINKDKYSAVKIIANLISSEKNTSPIIKSLSAYFLPLPELAVNYQTVSFIDTIKQGNRIKLSGKIYNVSKTKTDSFRINFFLMKNGNINYQLLDTLISNLPPYSHVPFTCEYENKLNDNHGKFDLVLEIDKGNNVRELYENNNVFIKPIYIIKDTITSVKHANIIVKFNGREIQERDYIEPQSLIQIEVSFASQFTEEDTTAIRILLDNEAIPFSKLKNIGEIDYDMPMKRMTITFSYNFEEGEHSLKIFLRDISGRISDRLMYEKYFLVTSEIAIKNIYNFPNPFSSETFFTFILTQMPDEVIIKIYTVTGRLIKEIKINDFELENNLNRIYWDGRDEDGNLVANGVYFYKIIAKKGNKICSSIQKMAVIR